MIALLVSLVSLALLGGLAWICVRRGWVEWTVRIGPASIGRVAKRGSRWVYRSPGTRSYSTYSDYERSPRTRALARRTLIDSERTYRTRAEATAALFEQFAASGGLFGSGD